MTLLAPQKWEEKNHQKANTLPEVAAGQKKGLDAGCRRLGGGMSGAIPPADPCTAEGVCRAAYHPRGLSLVPPWVVGWPFSGSKTTT